MKEKDREIERDSRDMERDTEGEVERDKYIEMERDADREK